MNVSTHNEIIDKAKSKSDGVYSHKGYRYAVKGNSFIAYCDNIGYCYAVYGIFITSIGRVDRGEIDKALKDYIKNTKQ